MAAPTTIGYPRSSWPGGWNHRSRLSSARSVIRPPPLELEPAAPDLDLAAAGPGGARGRGGG
eukprot:scaffold1554_cov401-Prasinococcus_capsulatus_cf.AAC.29